MASVKKEITAYALLEEMLTKADKMSIVKYSSGIMTETKDTLIRIPHI